MQCLGFDGNRAEPLTVVQDTEFPGVVARPIGTFKTTSDYHYQTLRCNVDLLNVIQVGLTFSDAYGNVAPGTCTWQFNIKFSVKYESNTSALRGEADDWARVCIVQ